MTPDERHAVAGELRWLAHRREQNAVMSPQWLRQRADWIEVSGERRAPARERGTVPKMFAPEDIAIARDEDGDIIGYVFDPNREWDADRRADVLDSVLRWGEPR